METTQTTTPASDAPAAKLRTPDAIKADLAVARERHAQLMPQVEKDRVKRERQAERIEKAKRAWKLSHDADDPFDPHDFSPPMLPYPGDVKVHEAFHKSHYEVSALEGELAKAVKAVATA